MGWKVFPNARSSWLEAAGEGDLLGMEWPALLKLPISRFQIMKPKVHEVKVKCVMVVFSIPITLFWMNCFLIYFEISKSERFVSPSVCSKCGEILPWSKSLNTKKKKPRSTHVVVYKNIRTFGLKWTLYLLAHIKTVRKGRMEKRTKTNGEILRQKGDDQCTDTCGKIFITPNLIVIIIKNK